MYCATKRSFSSPCAFFQPYFAMRRRSSSSAFVFIVQKVGDLVDEIIVGTEKDHFIIGEQLIQAELLVGKGQNTIAGELGYPVR